MSLRYDYVLFAHHYPPGGSADELFRRRLPELAELLGNPERPGLLVLGLTDALFQWFQNLENEPAAAERDAALGDWIRQESAAAGIAGRVIPIGYQELCGLRDFSPLREQPAQWSRWLGGGVEASRYDKPKLIEAFVRVQLGRQNGPEIPLLRLDGDVLFNDVNPAMLHEPIRAACERFAELNRLPGAEFVISGDYSRKPAAEMETVHDWIGAFATRVFPALTRRPRLRELATLKPATDAETQTLNAELLAELEAAFCRENAIAFYGLTDDAEQPSEPARGIAALGAPLFQAPISGSLLTYPARLAVKIPPWCSASSNIVWIDDFLKLTLLREFNRDFRGNLSPTFLRESRIPHCTTDKRRPAQSLGFDGYVLGNYIPGLVKGIVLDAWMQPAPATKSDLWASAKPGLLPRLLAKGKNELDEAAFRAAAVARLAELDRQWSALAETYAAAWVTTALRKSPAVPVVRYEDLADGARATLVENLIDDVRHYFGWFAAWPALAAWMQTRPALLPGLV